MALNLIDNQALVRKLNKLTDTYTAYNNVQDLIAACQGGFVPTLPPETRQLARFLRALGFRVFDRGPLGR